MSAEEPSSHFRESRVDATTDQSLEDQAHLEAGSLTSPHDFLWNMGEQFNTASSDSAQDVLQAGVTSLGMSSGAMHAGIWSFESDTSDLTPMHRWRGGDRPFGVTEYLLPALRPGPWMQAVMDADVGKVSQFEASEVLREPGQHDGLILSIGVISVDGPRSIFITIFHSREVNASVGPIYTMLRGFMILTRQFRRRLDLEAQIVEMAERQVQLHDHITRSTHKLTNATFDSLQALTQTILADTADLLDVPIIANLTTDYEQERYVQTALEKSRDSQQADPTLTPLLHRREALNTARLTGTAVQVTPDSPTLANPNLLAIPRGGLGRPSAILVAESLRPGPWPSDQVQLFERLSETLLAVETRLGSDQRSAAALASSPMPIALRRKNDLALIDGNSAFLAMLGESAIEPLIGSFPRQVLYASITEVPEAFRHASEWLFEEIKNQTTEIQLRVPTLLVFKGPGGMPILGKMICTEVPSTPDDFILVHIEDITSRIQNERELEFLADHDQLTGLLLRRGFRERIDEMQKTSGPGALAIIDMDKFKNINDSFGHETGNGILQETANRLREHVRPGDAVARLGGDEFAVALRGPLSAGEAQKIMQRLLDEMCSVAQIDSERIYPAFSAGVALWEEDSNIDLCFINADAAMYEAKETGGRRLALYEPRISDKVLSRRTLETGLIKAIQNDEFLVQYEPEVSLLTGKIIGAEALVRWQHPEQGLLAAGLFMPQAEAIGLAIDIKSIVLKKACADAASWPRRNSFQKLRVKAELDDLIGPSRLMDALLETDLDKDRLCLEVTQTTRGKNLDLTIKAVTELQRLGVSLALSGVGGGYGKMRDLKNFDFAMLKIDQSFVSDLTDDSDSQKFIVAFAAMAEVLGLAVIADGVETSRQAEILSEIGCTGAQGFFFHKPMPASDLCQLLEAQAHA